MARDVIRSNSFVISAGTSSNITVEAGNGQSAAVTTNYAQPAQSRARRTRWGTAGPGVAVTFAAPRAGRASRSRDRRPLTPTAAAWPPSPSPPTPRWALSRSRRPLPALPLPPVFSLTNVPGSASTSGFRAGSLPVPVAGALIIAPPITVQLTDRVGNNVAQAGVAVTLSLNPAAGRSIAITGTTTVATNDSGLASFADLGIGTAEEAIG